MIIHNFNIIGLAIMPPETDAPLFVDTDAMLTDAISFKGFEPVSSNGCQIVKVRRRVKPAQPFLRSSLNALKPPAAEAVMQRFRLCASK
jgi:hypothetical protein